MKIPGPSRPPGGGAAGCHEYKSCGHRHVVCVHITCHHLAPLSHASWQLSACLVSALCPACNKWSPHLTRSPARLHTVYLCSSLPTSLRPQGLVLLPWTNWNWPGSTVRFCCCSWFSVYPSSKNLTSKRIYYLEVLMKFIRFILRFLQSISAKKICKQILFNTSKY